MSRELDVVTMTGEEYDEIQNEIERLTDLNRVLEAGFMEAVKQIAKSDPVGVSRWLKEQGVTTPNDRVEGRAAASSRRVPLERRVGRILTTEKDMTNKNIETVQRIDFDRLDMLVSERIGALKLYAQNIGAAHDVTLESGDGRSAMKTCATCNASHKNTVERVLRCMGCVAKPSGNSNWRPLVPNAELRGRPLADGPA